MKQRNRGSIDNQKIAKNLLSSMYLTQDTLMPKKYQMLMIGLIMITIVGIKPSAEHLELNRISESFNLAQEELISREPVSGHLEHEGDNQTWYIQVFQNAFSLRVVITGPSDADFDIYVRYGEIPTLSDYDIRGYSSSSNEDEEILQPLSGTWFIIVNSYDGSGFYTLTVYVSYSETTSYSTSPVIPRIPLISEEDFPQAVILILSVLGLIVVIWSINRS